MVKSYAENLALFGYPITEPYQYTDEQGQTFQVQWFERTRFEWHPENPNPFKVLRWWARCCSWRRRCCGGSYCPVNARMADWTPETMPPDWERFRAQCEYTPRAPF